MRRPKCIQDKRGWYIGLDIISSVMILVLAILLTASGAVRSEVFNDAYSYEDSFEDTSGLNLAQTWGFEPSEGAILAAAASAVVVSECISLPQPEGGTFLGWSFLEIGLAGLDSSPNTLEVQDCDGNILKTFSNLPEGENSLDLSEISTPAIRLRWRVDQAGARLNFWHIYGRATGAICLEIAPDRGTVDSGVTVTFTITLSTSGARARNPVLLFSLDTINGLSTPDIDDGLAEDAEADYGGGVLKCRPLEFVSATRGPKGELPETPETGATSGEVLWALEDMSDGFSDNLAVTLRVPKGYIKGKTLAARAVLEHGLYSGSGTYNNRMSQDRTSGQVVVNSVPAFNQTLIPSYNNPKPGITNTYDVCYIYAVKDNPSDLEDIKVTITGDGTCLPLFRSVFANCEYPYQVLTTPLAGAPITSNDPIIIHFDRADFNGYDSSIYTILIFIYYDVPDDCIDGDNTVKRSEVVVGNPALVDTFICNQNIEDVLEYCCSGGNYTYRVMSGNYNPLNYLFWPGYSEYYLYSNASLRAGEYFSTSAFLGVGIHTVPLDHSYVLTNIPEGVSFHGVIQPDKLDKLYKDCTGTAPDPNNPAFNHNDSPPHPAWKPVEITWSGLPFDRAPDEDDPNAVILPGCRLLGVEDSPDYGYLWRTFLWRVCDGSYGCTELPEDTAMSLGGGQIFTYETVSNPLGVTWDCNTYPGSTLYKELKSWPKIYSWSEKDQFPAGDIAHIIINPENRNYASQWVNGRWVVNLYGIRGYVDLAGVSGQVITEGLNIPGPGQNITGESCNTAEITFHPPDPAGCYSALSEDDQTCMAWWEVPPACQPPNGWGYQISGDWGNDDYVQIYRFRLNAPILNTTPAGTALDFTAEVRTNDLSAIGADNAVEPARWPISNYTATTSITVLELPGLDVEKSGPVVRKQGDTVTYTLEITNYGNTPNEGWYLVDWLPRDSVNSSEFTPEYGRVYINRMPDDIQIEYSMDEGCFTNPLGGAWTAMTLQATSRIGYLAETAGSIDPGATCLRLRQNPATTMHFNPGDVILAAVDVVIPVDASLEGKWMYNSALAGAATVFGAPSEVPPVETINVRTRASSEVVVEVEKTFETDPARAGWIKWMLRVHNTSGENAVNIHVVDELPTEIIYEGLAGSPPSGWGLLEEPAIGTTDSRIRIMINELGPDDGNPGTGVDEGGIAFWSRVIQATPCGTVIRNCATATPEYGSGGDSCASATVPCLEVNKSQEAVDRIVGTTITDVVPGDEIRYIITVKNNLDNAAYLWIHDELDMYVDYVPGTFTVKGAAASDSFISGGVLNYEYPAPLNPSETLTLTLDVIVRGGEYDTWTIGNTAQVLACIDPLDTSSCFPGIETPAVYAMAFCDKTDNDSDGFSICDMDCDDADPDTYPGAQEQCDGKDNDCDGKTDEESIVKKDLVKNWNMASLPVLPKDSRVSDIFPDAVVVYAFEKGSGYIRVRSYEDLEPGIGYWVLLPEAKSFEFSGECIPEYTLPVENGWYMIGSCSRPARASADIGSIEVIYRYDRVSGYQRLLTGEKLEPGTGYWILMGNIPDRATLRVKGE